jgi:hypothetical protein
LSKFLQSSWKVLSKFWQSSGKVQAKLAEFTRTSKKDPFLKNIDRQFGNLFLTDAKTYRILAVHVNQDLGRKNDHSAAQTFLQKLQNSRGSLFWSLFLPIFCEIKIGDAMKTNATTIFLYLSQNRHVFFSITFGENISKISTLISVVQFHYSFWPEDSALIYSQAWQQGDQIGRVFAF